MGKPCKFTQGYVCAVAVLVRTHSTASSTEVTDVLVCQCPTKQEAIDAGCDPDDIEELEEAWKYLERRNAPRNAI